MHEYRFEKFGRLTLAGRRWFLPVRLLERGTDGAVGGVQLAARARRRRRRDPSRGGDGVNRRGRRTEELHVTRREVDITLPTVGRGGKVVVDGEDVSHGTRAVRVSSAADDVTIVELDVVPRVALVHGRAHVVPVLGLDEPDAELRARVDVAVEKLEEIVGWLDVENAAGVGGSDLVSRAFVLQRVRDTLTPLRVANERLLRSAVEESRQT